ncbi:MAG: hypothetical protein AABY79_01715 [Nitrospirota bacterium]|jgi:hypothetical protein
MDNNSILISVIKEAVSPLATLLAAFFGAWFAYRFQDRVKARDVISANISAANKAMFKVFQLLNSLALFQKDVIDPCRGRPDICFTMLPMLPDDHSDYRFDFQGLGFILDSKHKKIMLDLFIEEQRYREAIKAINARSMLHKGFVQPALVSAGFKEDSAYPVELFAQALGPLLFKDIQNLTNQVIYHVDRTVKSLEETKNNMHAAFKEMFPEGNFLNIELVK